MNESSHTRLQPTTFSMVVSSICRHARNEQRIIEIFDPRTSLVYESTIGDSSSRQNVWPFRAPHRWIYIRSISFSLRRSFSRSGACSRGGYTAVQYLFYSHEQTLYVKRQDRNPERQETAFQGTSISMNSTYSV